MISARSNRGLETIKRGRYVGLFRFLSLISEEGCSAGTRHGQSLLGIGHWFLSDYRYPITGYFFTACYNSRMVAVPTVAERSAAARATAVLVAVPYSESG